DPADLSIDDTFFELGGDSLLAIRLSSRARTALDAEISVQTLFGHPTIGELAQNLEGRGRAARAPLVFVADRPNPAPLSRGQQRMWFQHRLEGPDSGLDNIPLALRLRGLLDIDALRAALGDVIARHEILRTLYQADDQDGLGTAHQKVL